jgi:ubiquinone/menaquinone biosynthesis C-methylase UbiE
MKHRKSLLAAIVLAAAIVSFWSFRSILPGTIAASPSASSEISRLAELMHWQSGTVMADIGAGDGRYSFEAAKIVGASGRVYATEIDTAKLAELRESVTKRKLTNVTIVEGAVDDTKLPSACCDAIFLRRVYHHITAPQPFDANLLRSLKPGAHLAIIDFPPTNAYGPVPGVPANRGGHGIPQKILVEELTAAGFRVEKTIAHWSGDDYCVIFLKPGD